MPGHVVGHFHHIASLFVTPVVVHHVEEGVEPLQPVLLLLGKLDPRAPVHWQGFLHDRRVHGVDVVEQDPGSGLCGVVVRKLAVVSLPIRLRDVAQASSDVVLGEVIHAAVGHDAQGALQARPAHAQHSIVTSRSMRNVLARVKAEMLVEGVPVVLENVAESHIGVEIGVVKLSKISKVEKLHDLLNLRVLLVRALLASQHAVIAVLRKQSRPIPASRAREDVKGHGDLLEQKAPHHGSPLWHAPLHGREVGVRLPPGSSKERMPLSQKRKRLRRIAPRAGSLAVLNQRSQRSWEDVHRVHELERPKAQRHALLA